MDNLEDELISQIDILRYIHTSASLIIIYIDEIPSSCKTVSCAHLCTSHKTIQNTFLLNIIQYE